MERDEKDNTIHLISRVRRRANQFLLDEMEYIGMDGLAPSHGEIIFSLLQQGELTMSQIAEVIDRDRSTVTALMNKLIQLGYVQTKRSPYCGRTTLAFLTEKGEGLRTEFKEISYRLNQCYQYDIDPQELLIFKKVLNKVEENFKSKDK